MQPTSSRPITAQALAARMGRLNRQLVKYQERVKQTANPESPTEKRASTFAAKGLKKVMREMEDLNKRPVLKSAGQRAKVAGACA